MFVSVFRHTVTALSAQLVKLSPLRRKAGGILEVASDISVLFPGGFLSFDLFFTLGILLGSEGEETISKKMFTENVVLRERKVNKTIF